MTICKIIVNNPVKFQQTAFKHGIEWFGSGQRMYEAFAYVTVVKYFVNGKDRLFLLKGDSAERYNQLDCFEIKEQYFIDNVKKLVEKYK